MNSSVAGDTGDTGDDSGEARASFDLNGGFSPSQLVGNSSRLLGAFGTRSEAGDAADRFGSIVYGDTQHAH
jgi:hypothetical protein